MSFINDCLKNRLVMMTDAYAVLESPCSGGDFRLGRNGMFYDHCGVLKADMSAFFRIAFLITVVLISAAVVLLQ